LLLSGKATSEQRPKSHCGYQALSVKQGISALFDNSVKDRLTLDVMPVQYYKYYSGILSDAIVDISGWNRELRSVNPVESSHARKGQRLAGYSLRFRSLGGHARDRSGSRNGVHLRKAAVKGHPMPPLDRRSSALQRWESVRIPAASMAVTPGNLKRNSIRTVGCRNRREHPIIVILRQLWQLHDGHDRTFVFGALDQN